MPDNLARVLTFPEKQPTEKPQLDELTRLRLDAVMAVWLPARLAKETHKQYRGALTHFLRAAGHRELMDALADEATALESFSAFCRAIEGHAAASRRLYLTAIRKLVTAAEDCRLIDFTIHQYIDLPSTAHDFLYPDDLPSPAQCQQAISTEKDLHDAWAFQCLYYMALRTSEVCGLRWEQLKVVGGVLAFEVTGKGKTSLVRVPAPILQQVTEKAQAAGRTGLVCPTPEGRPYTRLRLYRACAKAWARVGYENKNAVGQGGHLWRHCHASHAKMAGVDKETLRVSLRHTSEKTQDIYVHVVPPSSGDLLGLKVELPGE